MRKQPIRQVAQQKHFAKRHAQFKQAEIMQWKARAMRGGKTCIRQQFDRLIIRYQRGGAAIVDKAQQPVIGAIKSAQRCCSNG